jgi:glycosyltransferase involved in cell wall biosynthesis
MDDLWWYRRLAGALAARARRRRPRDGVRSVAFLSPARFADDSIVGGGERTAWELAAAMARLVPTRLITFGPERLSATRGPLAVEVHRPRRWIADAAFDPLSFGFVRDLAGADVVHCNHYFLAAPQLAILTAAALGKRVYVTDRGAMGHHLDAELDVAACVTEFVSISRFSGALMPRAGAVIPDGVPELFLRREERPCGGRVLYVGRIMRHKGIDVLIDALEPGTGLDVLGRVYDDEYVALLRQRARGKDVRFVHDASDEVVAEHYRRALVTVLPSVHDDVFGGHWDRPELLGGVLQESMATGTPVICTAVGGMPEVVRDGENGFVVPPNDPAALRAAIARLADDPDLRRRLGERGRAGVRSWDATAREMLERYRA